MLTQKSVAKPLQPLGHDFDAKTMRCLKIDVVVLAALPATAVGVEGGSGAETAKQPSR